MASEITSSATLSVSKGGASISGNGSRTQDMSGEDMVQNTQLIGNGAAETLDFGEITGAPAQVLIQNLDSTNYIEIGGDSGLTVFKLKLAAGDVCKFTPTSATVYAQANTAAVRIMVWAVEA